MNNIEPDEFFINFKEGFLEIYNGEVIPNNILLRTSELSTVVSRKNSTSDFIDRRLICYMVLFSDGSGAMVPWIYRFTDRISLIKGEDLIPKEEDENILDNIDFDSEFEFAF